jgi:hypothetical protein
LFSRQFASLVVAGGEVKIADKQISVAGDVDIGEMVGTG